MRKFINSVTLSGVDDKVDYEVLNTLSRRYPFLEVGVLFSKSNMGSSRYPSKRWIEKAARYGFPMSGHICGEWMRDICYNGGENFIREIGWKCIDPLCRLQLNFSKEYSDISDLHKFTDCLWKFNVKYPLILQMEKYDEDFLNRIKIEGGSFLDVSILIDCSAGKGLLPVDWDFVRNINDKWFGLAGGLTPDNIEDQITKIQEVILDDCLIWLDMESGVRDMFGNFDMEKAIGVLSKIEKYIWKGE